MTLKDITREVDGRMQKSLESVVSELAKVRTGKASPALLDSIRVDYYGSPTSLNQVAQVGAPEVRLLTVEPYERNMMGAIEKAIRTSDLGLNPTNDGQRIRILIPALTEERRKDYVKLVRRFGEEGRVAVRNVRRDGNDSLKKADKAGDMAEDERKRGEKEIQDMTDRAIKQIDELLGRKEAEVMEV